MTNKSPRNIKRIFIVTFSLIALAFVAYKTASELGYNIQYAEGQKIDSLHHVIVYYNGATGNVFERNITSDNYNLGLKYQCVEFVKRYYYEYLDHKMPNTYGNAIDFYNPELSDGALNSERNLIQYSNRSKSKPRINDLIILDVTLTNQFGHVGIVSSVTENEIELIQQNCGAKTRVCFDLEYIDGKWYIDSDRILGWLRKK